RSPLSSSRLAFERNDWDAQLLYFLGKGYRVIAHDRRGHGPSSQVSEGHDMDHYAADASAVCEHLNLRNAVHIGHSTGGGETMTSQDNLGHAPRAGSYTSDGPSSSKRNNANARSPSSSSTRRSSVSRRFPFTIEKCVP